jgi:hypothetical protein
LVCGVIVSALIGGLTDYRARTQRELVHRACGDLALSTLVAAYRTSRRGPVPADADIRSAALKIANYQLRLVPDRANLRFLLPACTAVPLLIGLSATSIPGSMLPILGLLALASALCAVTLLVQTLYWPGRLRSRIRLLTASGHPVSS